LLLMSHVSSETFSQGLKTPVLWQKSKGRAPVGYMAVAYGIVYS